MENTLPITADLDARFEDVRVAFEAVLAADARSTRQGAGASFAVWHQGTRVVHLYGGYQDKAAQIPWADDTLACVYSSGKAVVAMLIAQAVQAGTVNYETPVAEIWPAFASGGKSIVTLGQVLSHQAGLPGFVKPVDPAIWLDWDATCAALAAAAPLWTPGEAQGYHPQTFGFLAGEPLRRKTGQSVGALIRKKSLDVYCGMDNMIAARTATMVKPPKAPDLGEINPATKAAFLERWSAPTSVARADWLAAEIPASNMHATADGLAAFVHPLANGGKDVNGKILLENDVLEEFYRTRSHRADQVLPYTLSWGAGMMHNVNKHFGPNDGAMGHAGFGGSMVVVDPDHQISASFVMNRMSPHLVGDPRTLTLLEALYAALK
ncbi:MAG: serine hydrolase domain-containing protein [Pseudomonadota bacterium]